MFNPEYPNFFFEEKWILALDFDFFFNEIIDSSDEILQVFDKGHNEIQSMFESSLLQYSPHRGDGH